MNYRQIYRMLGAVCLFVAVLMLPALALNIVDKAPLSPFLVTIAIGLSLGFIVLRAFRSAKTELGRRDGFVLVSLVWVTASLLGALPFWFSGEFGSFTNAVFESVSGYTTTGATVLGKVSHLPRGILLWRAMIQWLGGMGIVLLSMAVMPLLGFGGVLLFKAESPGPSIEKLRPRIRATSMLLWWVYVLVTAAAFLCLMLAGMPPFDALCHAFTVLASGGFSTHDAGIMGYGNPAVEWTLIVFMLAAGMNFVLHYHFLRGNRTIYLKNEESRWYLLVYLMASLVILGLLLPGGTRAGVSFGELVRQAFFQTASILTTTGYHSVDFEAWRLAVPAVGVLLIVIMFIGGMGGSTAGGIKTVRLLVIVKEIRLSLYELAHPRVLKRMRINGEVVPDARKRTMVAFVFLYLVVFLLGALALAAMGLDEITAVSSVAACLNTIGPGFGQVGPLSNYADLPTLAKWILLFAMLIGRLELYTLLVLFSPAFWRR